MNFANLKKWMLAGPLAGVLLLAGAPFRAQAQDTAPTAAPSANVETAIMTITPRGYAQVDAYYNFKLNKGLNRLVLDRLPKRILNSSIGTDKFSGPITLGPVTYRDANLSSRAIEAQLINKPVTLIVSAARATDAPKEVAGTLLSLEGDTAVLRDGNGLITKVPGVQGWKCNALPDGLNNTPSLTIELDAKEAGEYKGVIRYRAVGFKYTVTHAWEYDEKASTIRWTSDVHVVNNSGGEFKQVELSFAAGDTGADQADMANEAANAPRARGMMLNAAPPAPGGAPMQDAAIHEATVEDLSGVQVFTLPSKVTMQNAEMQKVPFFRSPATVPVDRENRLDLSYGWYSQSNQKQTLQNQKISTVFKFINSKKNGIGLPIPHGKVVVEARDSRGRLKGIGGTNLTDTAIDEKGSYVIGSDWNLKGTRKIVNFKQTRPARIATPEGYDATTSDGNDIYYYETITTWDLATEVSNGKDHAVSVIVEEDASNSNVLQGNHGFKQVREGLYEQTINVPAGGKTEITYTVKRVDIGSRVIKKPVVTPPVVAPPVGTIPANVPPPVAPPAVQQPKDPNSAGSGLERIGPHRS
jgi:hypothetical protein